MITIVCTGTISILPLDWRLSTLQTTVRECQTRCPVDLPLYILAGYAPFLPILLISEMLYYARIGQYPISNKFAYGVRSQTMLCSVVSLRPEVNTNFPNVPLVVTIEQTTDLVNCIVTAAAAPAQYNTCRRSVQLDDLSWKLLRVLATRSSMNGL